MAVYAKAISSNDVINGQSTICPSPGGKNGYSFVMSGLRDQHFVNIDNQEAKIDAKYKHGGSGGWERPGSDFA